MKAVARLKTFKRYKPLLNELVRRDIKVRYRKSALGVAWTVLNPLGMMLVQVMVFSNFFRGNVENYPLYLIIGNIVFNFFSTATNMGLNSVLWNASLIKKVYIPKYLFPFSVTMSALVNFGFSAIAMVLVMILTGSSLHLTMLAIPIPLTFLVMFVLGMSLLLSAVNVYFRDIEHLYGVIITAWMYLTPIFYTIDIVPSWAYPFIYWNPMTQFIKYFRLLIMDGIFPSLRFNLGCMFSGIVMLAIGMKVFEKLQNNFILHI